MSTYNIHFYENKQNKNFWTKKIALSRAMNKGFECLPISIDSGRLPQCDK